MKITDYQAAGTFLIICEEDKKEKKKSIIQTVDEEEEIISYGSVISVGQEAHKKLGLGLEMGDIIAFYRDKAVPIDGNIKSIECYYVIAKTNTIKPGE